MEYLFAWRAQRSLSESSRDFSRCLFIHAATRPNNLLLVIASFCRHHSLQSVCMLLQRFCWCCALGSHGRPTAPLMGRVQEGGVVNIPNYIRYPR